MVSRADEPICSGLAPEERDTPPGDLPDLPDIPAGDDLPDDTGLTDPENK